MLSWKAKHSLPRRISVARTKAVPLPWLVASLGNGFYLLVNQLWEWFKTDNNSVGGSVCTVFCEGLVSFIVWNVVKTCVLRRNGAEDYLMSHVGPWGRGKEQNPSVCLFIYRIALAMLAALDRLHRCLGEGQRQWSISLQLGEQMVEREGQGGKGQEGMGDQRGQVRWGMEAGGQPWTAYFMPGASSTNLFSVCF